MSTASPVASSPTARVTVSPPVTPLTMAPLPVISLSQPRHPSPVGRPFSLSRLPVHAPSPDRLGCTDSGDDGCQVGRVLSPQRSSRKSSVAPSHGRTSPPAPVAFGSSMVATTEAAPAMVTSPTSTTAIPIIRQGHLLEMMYSGMVTWAEAEQVVARSSQYHANPNSQPNVRDSDHSTLLSEHHSSSNSNTAVQPVRPINALYRTDGEERPVFATPRDLVAASTASNSKNPSVRGKQLVSTDRSSTTRSTSTSKVATELPVSRGRHQDPARTGPLPQPQPKVGTVQSRSGSGVAKSRFSASSATSINPNPQRSTSAAKVRPSEISNPPPPVPPPPVAPVSRSSSSAAIRSASANRNPSRAKSPLHVSPNAYKVKELLHPPPSRSTSGARSAQDRSVSATSQSRITTSGQQVQNRVAISSSMPMAKPAPVSHFQSKKVTPCVMDTNRQQSLSEALVHYQDMVTQLTDMFYRSRVGVRAAVSSAANTEATRAHIKQHGNL